MSSQHGLVTHICVILPRGISGVGITKPQGSSRKRSVKLCNITSISLDCNYDRFSLQKTE